MLAMGSDEWNAAAPRFLSDKSVMLGSIGLSYTYGFGKKWQPHLKTAIAM